MSCTSRPNLYGRIRSSFLSTSLGCLATVLLVLAPGVQGYLRSVNITVYGSKSIYQQWSSLYPSVAALRDVNANINYVSGVNSADGRRALLSNPPSIWFSGSDASLPAADIIASNNTLRLLPILASAVVFVYNLPGLDSAHRLTLSRETVMGIFNGTVDTWDHPLMLRDNRDEYILKVLERKRITLVVREDLSGSTETMNNALRKFDGGWERFVMDSHSSVGWPRRDVPVSGAANMVLEVKKRSYSLGYVELSAANDYDAPFAYVINREGQATLPNEDTVRSALKNANTTNLSVSNSYLSVVDEVGQFSYPYSALTYLVIRLGNPKWCTDIYELVRYIIWSLEDPRAAQLASSSHFITLDEQFRRFSRTILDQMRCMQPGDDSYRSVVDQAMMDTSNEQTDVSEIIFITGVAVSFAAFLLAFCAVVYCCKGKAKGFRRYEVPFTDDELRKAEQEAQRSRNTCATYKLKAQWKGVEFRKRVRWFIAAVLWEIVGFVLEISALMTLSQSPFFTRIFISAVVIGVISAFIAFVCRCSALSFEYSHSHLELQITRILISATRRLPLTPIIAAYINQGDRRLVKRYLTLLLWAEFSEKSLVFMRRLPMILLATCIIYWNLEIHRYCLTIALFQSLTMNLSLSYLNEPLEVMKKFIWLTDLPDVNKNFDMMNDVKLEQAEFPNFGEEKGTKMKVLCGVPNVTLVG